MDIFRYSSGQIRAGGFGFIGFDMPAMLNIAEIIGVTITEDHLYCLRSMECAVMDLNNQDGKNA